MSEGKAMVFPVVMYGCESWTLPMQEMQETWVQSLDQEYPLE